MILSIIIPVYNVETYLRACLDSVVNEGIGNYEVIIVNDGSTDGSPEIIAQYASKFPGLINVVTKENGGLGSARNAGMDVAAGDYVVFLDSDDYLAENSVSEILEECRNGDFDICFFDQAFYNESGKRLMVVKGADKSGYFKFTDYPQILFHTPNAGNKIFRRSLFADHDISFPPRQWFEDINSVYKLYPYTENMKYIPKAWNCHLQREGSITHSTNTSRNLEMIDACRDLYDFYSAFPQYFSEIEYCIYYNEFLTSIDRVNLIDKKSEIQGKLIDWYVETFPEYKGNNYFVNMPFKYKLLHSLIINRRFGLLNIVLKSNEFVSR